MIARDPLFRQVCYVIVLGLAFRACGVKLHDQPPPSELLRSLTLSGSTTDQSGLRLELRYRQQYPVDIAVICTLQASDGTVTGPPARVTIPARDPEAPAAVAVESALAIHFPAAPPGTYTVRCVTEKAQDSISANITVPG